MPMRCSKALHFTAASANLLAGAREASCTVAHEHRQGQDQAVRRRCFQEPHQATQSLLPNDDLSNAQRVHGSGHHAGQHARRGGALCSTEAQSAVAGAKGWRRVTSWTDWDGNRHNRDACHLAFFVLADNTGRTSILSPTRSIPSRIEPPVVPPLKFSMSSPGIFASNKQITTSLSFEVKSRSGIGHKLLNLFVLSRSGTARNPKHLVLQNDDAPQGMISTAAKKVLRRMWLRAHFITYNKQQGGIHEGRQHCTG